jgi:hypothetical protein
MDGLREWECQFMCIVFGSWIKTWFRLGSLVISYKQSISLWNILSTFIKLIRTYLHKLTYLLNGLLNQQTVQKAIFLFDVTKWFGWVHALQVYLQVYTFQHQLVYAEFFIWHILPLKWQCRFARALTNVVGYISWGGVLCLPKPNWLWSFSYGFGW